MLSYCMVCFFFNFTNLNVYCKASLQCNSNTFVVFSKTIKETVSGNSKIDTLNIDFKNFTWYNIKLDDLGLAADTVKIFNLNSLDSMPFSGIKFFRIIFVNSTFLFYSNKIKINEFEILIYPFWKNQMIIWSKKKFTCQTRSSIRLSCVLTGSYLQI